MTTPVVVTFVVTFEETGEKREVRRACNRCYGNAVSVAELELIEVVSRYGTAHKGADYGETACGIDATGPDWWHRS